MHLSDNETRDIAELKKYLEEKAAKLENELSMTRLSLKLINEALTKVSFKPASKLVEQPQKAVAIAEADQVVRPSASIAATPVPERSVYDRPAAAEVRQSAQPAESRTIEPQEQGFPIKSKTGEDLGTFIVGDSSVRILPRPDLALSPRTPPFQSFFIDRVIGEMKRKDEMAVDAGSKDPMSIVEHQVLLEGDVIKEIRINNIDEDSRIRELRSSIRWTFERMLEKASRP